MKSAGEADHGTTIDAAPSEEIVVALPENPTTGYRWTIETIGDVTSSFEQSSSAQIGGGGMRMFRFVAPKSGTVTLRAVLRRAWDPPEQRLKEYVVTINVGEHGHDD